MKKLFPFIVLICLLGKIDAQDRKQFKNKASLSMNSVFFTSGDILGIGNSLGYVYKFNDYLAVNPRIFMLSGNDLDLVNSQVKEYHQITSYGTTLKLCITPFPKSFKRIMFGMGGIYQNYTKAWGTIGQQDVHGTYEGLTTKYHKEKLWGFVGSVSINILDYELFESGIRIELLTSLSNGYLNSDALSGGIYFSYKF